jgi:sulfur carrier protein
LKVQVNGEWCEVRAADLAGALAELGFRHAVIATAVNDEFVPVGDRATLALDEGDRIEVLAPMQGG